jgi:hypothetical protein
MKPPIDIRAWREDEIKQLRERIAIIEAGKIRYHSTDEYGVMTDITDELLASTKDKLAAFQAWTPTDAHWP